MDNILNQVEYNFNSNSMVIGVLRSAMDKAHEKLQCKHGGPIEFLHERSKFYELSSILVEAVLNIIEEIDILENNGEKIRLDLLEIEHWLQGRVKQTKFSLVEKDKELKEKIVNELRLKQALELKEKELVYLREKLEIEKSRSEDEVEVFDESNNLNDQHDIQDEEENEEFSAFDSERHEQSEVIQQMSSDINILIGTLDFAFGRMHEAEILPLEKKWKWTIEKDILLVLMRGFLKDIQQNVEEKLEERKTSTLNHSTTMNEEMINVIRERDCKSIQIILFEMYLFLLQDSKKLINRYLRCFAGHRNVNMDKKTCMIDSCTKLLIREIESLGTQCDDQRIETFLLEEIYQILFQCLIEGISSMKEDVIDQECINDRSLEEKIDGTIRNGSMKTENNDVSCISCQALEPLKSLLKVDVCMVYLKEMARTWTMEIDDHHLENLFKEYIYQFVVIEVVKDDRKRVAQNMHSSVKSYGNEDESYNVKRLEFLPEKSYERNQRFHAKEFNIAMKIAPYRSLHQLIDNFEKLVQEKVERNCLRVVELKNKMLELSSLIILLKRENSLYKKAFIKRCRNLSLAEAEVDLLGDEVDSIRNVLKTVYQVLDQNSSALSNYIEVNDLMKLIMNELILV